MNACSKSRRSERWCTQVSSSAWVRYVMFREDQVCSTRGVRRTCGLSLARSLGTAVPEHVASKPHSLVVSAIVVEKGQVSGMKKVAMRTFKLLKKDTDTAIFAMTHLGCYSKKAG